MSNDAETMLVRKPAWRIRRGEEKRDVSLAIIVSPALASAFRELAAKDCTTVSTLGESIFAEYVRGCRAQQSPDQVRGESQAA